MQMTVCPQCKRVVPATRRTRAYVEGGRLIVETYLKPMRHLEDMTTKQMELCPLGLEDKEAA
jgi:hypothetical protein